MIVIIGKRPPSLVFRLEAIIITFLPVDTLCCDTEKCSTAKTDRKPQQNGDFLRGRGHCYCLLGKKFGMSE